MATLPDEFDNVVEVKVDSVLGVGAAGDDGTGDDTAEMVVPEDVVPLVEFDSPVDGETPP